MDAIASERDRTPRWQGALLCGVALSAALACGIFAVRADQRWFERHLLLLTWHGPPSHAVPLVARACAAAGALLLAWAAQRLRHAALPSAGAWVHAAFAVLLALGAAEGLLRLQERHRPADQRMLHVRLGRPHARYGWQMQDSRTVTLPIQGRQIELALDARGDRVRSEREAPDPALPSLLMAGESIAFGHALRWDETALALAAQRLSLQPVSLSVNGYGVDQAYLRLVDALPRFAQPRAVAMFIVPVQLARNLVDDHPRLSLEGASGFALLPPASEPWASLRLRALWQRIALRSDEELARSLSLTRALLLDVAQRARARGARPLFVLPSPGPARPLDAHPEAFVAHALFDGGGLPHVIVDLDETERFPRDDHPNPRGAARLAEAVVSALRN